MRALLIAAQKPGTICRCFVSGDQTDGAGFDVGDGSKTNVIDLKKLIRTVERLRKNCQGRGLKLGKWHSGSIVPQKSGDVSAYPRTAN